MLQAIEHASLPPGVIWISGYSGAGKTTVARKLARLLEGQATPVILLDGDELRSMFAAKWGYERHDRQELATVYFRLCNHLASQGFLVVLSAVAMYDDVRAWARVHVDRLLEVYLRAPRDVLVERDRATKRVYERLPPVRELYDEPSAADLTIDNFGETSPERAAEAVAAAYELRHSAGAARAADKGRSSHWNAFYAKPSAPAEASPFARFVAERLQDGARLLDVGCGNGRDSAFFARLGHEVLGVDVSEAAIAHCAEAHRGTGAAFAHGPATSVAPEERAFDAVYARFVIHAMPEAEEVALLSHAYALLGEGGLLALECRSVKDPMFLQGEVISPTERIHGHYRRFIVREELVERVGAAGFATEEVTESNGLAVFGDEDPVVIRVLARKRGRARRALPG